jgi:hypothetical protein
MSDIQKLKLSVGAVQIEYEGDLSQLKTCVSDLLEVISNGAPSAMASHANRSADSQIGTSLAANGNAKIQATTNTIAGKIGCNSGPDLIKAACVQLTLVQGKDEFTRQEIINEMKTSSYHKENYVGNMSASLKSLIKANFLNEKRKDVFAIHPSNLSSLEAQIA